MKTIKLSILSISLSLSILWLGAWGHEQDLIRHCVEENTLKTWNSEYTFKCKAIKEH